MSNFFQTLDSIATIIFCGASHETKYTIAIGVLLDFDEEIIKIKANEISRRLLEKA